MHSRRAAAAQAELDEVIRLGGAFEAVEGSARERSVVLEFPSYQAALDCYRSPEYARAKALRQDASDGDLVVLSGFGGLLGVLGATAISLALAGVLSVGPSRSAINAWTSVSSAKRSACSARATVT